MPYTAVFSWTVRARDREAGGRVPVSGKRKAPTMDPQLLALLYAVFGGISMGSAFAPPAVRPISTRPIWLRCPQPGAGPLSTVLEYKLLRRAPQFPMHLLDDPPPPPPPPPAPPLALPRPHARPEVYPAFIKTPAVLEAQVHPVVFQCYKSGMVPLQPLSPLRLTLP